MKFSMILLSIFAFGIIAGLSMYASRNAEEKQDRIMYRYCVGFSLIGIAVISYLALIRYREGLL